MITKSQLKRLMSKKRWTGKEAGKLLLTNMIHEVKQTGKPDKKPLFSQEEFNDIIRTFTEERDFEVCRVYGELNVSIVDSLNRGQGLFQQFNNGFFRLFGDLREAQNTDKAQKRLNDAPIIVTASQYERLKEKARDQLRGFEESFSGALFYCLEKFLEADDDIVEKEAPEVFKVLLSARETPATGNRFYSEYNRIYGLGYYQLPNGVRSDSMSKDEWALTCQKYTLEQGGRDHNSDDPKDVSEALTDYNFDQQYKAYDLLLKGGEAIRSFVLEKTGKTTDLSNEELENTLTVILEDFGFPEGEGYSLLSKALNLGGFAEWHDYEEPPEDLTLYDVFSLYKEELWDEGKEKEALQSFKKDCPDLYKALKAYIESKVPRAKELKANQLHKKVFSWGGLADAGIIGYDELTKPDKHSMTDALIGKTTDDTAEDVSKRRRGAFKGFAVIQDPDESVVDENGDYIEVTSPISDYMSLYSLEKDNEKIEKLHGFVNNLINPALGYLYAFNDLMKIFEEVYEVKGLAEELSFDTSAFELRMEAYNKVLYLFFKNVYGSEADKKHKREIIKKAFLTLNYEKLKPTKEAMEAVTQEIRSIGFSKDAKMRYKYLDQFIYRLMGYGA